MTHLVVDDDDDPHYDQFIRDTEPLEHATIKAQGETERDDHLEELLNSYTSYLNRRDADFHFAVIWGASLFFFKLNSSGRAIMWNWWKEVARKLQVPQERGQLGSTFVDPVAEHPQDADDIDHLMSFFHDPEISWVPCIAFDQHIGFPATLKSAYNEYRDRERAKGNCVPPFPEEELQKYLEW